MQILKVLMGIVPPNWFPVGFSRRAAQDEDLQATI
jgi:hypothetical protein